MLTIQRARIGILRQQLTINQDEFLCEDKEFLDKKLEAILLHVRRVKVEAKKKK
jgi:hypothetical protein